MKLLWEMVLSSFFFVVIIEVTVVVIIIFGGGDQFCVTYCLHLIVIHFPPLFVTTSPSGGDTYCLQNVVAASDFSFHGRDTLISGVGGVAAAGVVLQNLVVAASRIALL